jgi:hypothetical protein
VAYIKARLAVPNGAGIYTYNTSAAGQVVNSLVPMNMLPTNQTLPFWQVVPLYQGDTEPGPTNHLFQRSGQVAVVGYVTAASPTTDSRTDAATNLMQDGLNALEADITFGGLLREPMTERFWQINGLEFDGAGSIGSCSFEIHFAYTTVIGTGL